MAQGVPEIVIPIRFDTTGADAAVAEMQARLVKAFNQAKILPGSTGATSFDSVQKYLNNVPTPAQLGQMRGQSPGFGRALDQYNKFAASGSTSQASSRDSADTRRNQQQQSQLLKQLVSQHRESTNQMSRGLAVGGALAMGNSGPLQRAAAGWALSSMSEALAGVLGARVGRSGGGGNSGTRNGGGSSSTVAPGGPSGTTTSFISQVASTTASAVTSKLATAALTTGTDAAETGIASSASGLTAIATNPAVLAAAALVGLGLGANAANSWAASMRRQQYDLEANVSGSGGGQYAEGAAIDLSHKYITDKGTVAQVMEALGTQGVQGIGNINEDTGNALALSRITGIGLDQSEQLTGTLGAQGGDTPQEIGGIFDTIVKGSKDLNISMTGLVGTLTAFTKATNGASLSLQGAQSLMALQGLVGTSMNVGSIIAPSANAGGATAMGLSSILGISQTQLYQLQSSNPAGLAAMLGTKESQIAGSGGTATDKVNRMLAINAQLPGGFDFSQNSIEQQHQFYSVVASTNSTSKIEAAYKKLQDQAKAGDGSGFRLSGHQVSGDVTSQEQQIQNAYMNVANLALNAGLGNTTQMKQWANPKAWSESADGAAPHPLGQPGGSIGGSFLQLARQVASIHAQDQTTVTVDPKTGKSTIHPGVYDPTNNALLKDLNAAIMQGLSWAGDEVKQGAGSLGDSILSALGTTFSNIFGGAGNAVGSAVSDVTHDAGSAASGVSHFFSGLFGGGGSAHAGGLTDQTYSVPTGHADGGSDTITGSMLGSFEKASTSIGPPKGYTTEQWLRLLLATSAHESDFQIGATSSAGAMGIGQLMPATVQALVGKGGPFAGDKVAIDKSGAFMGAGTFNPYNPDQAAVGEAYWLSQKISGPGGGNIPLGIADYYGDGQTGPGSYSATIRQDAANITVTIVDKSSNGVNASVTQGSTAAPGIDHSRTPKGSRSNAPKHPLPPKPQPNPTPPPTPPVKRK